MYHLIGRYQWMKDGKPVLPDILLFSHNSYWRAWLYKLWINFSSEPAWLMSFRLEINEKF